MNTTKAQVIARRNTLFLGLPAGILMFLAMRTIPTSTLGAQTKYSFLFVDITSWPDIFKIGFLPLDFVFAVGWTMIFFYLAFYGLSEDGQTQLLNERRGAAKYILGTIVACAAMGGAFSTGRNGWYIGLEAVLMSAIALVAALGIGALAFIIMSGIIGWARKIVHQRASQKAATQSQEPRSDRRANLPCLEHARKLKGYLEADDIPDDPAT